MNKKIRVALAAYGMSGRLFHAPFLQTNPDFELVKILERSRDDSRGQVPNAEIVRDYEDILQDESIDLVVVNTPNPFHYDMARAALRTGKHVVLEKPITPTVAEGQDLIKLATEQGLMLSVYHNRRFASGYLTAKKILAEKSLGELKSFTVNLDRYRPEPGPKKWKEEQNPGAGLLYDIGIHLLDEALLLFGLPMTITADLRIQRARSAVNDYFSIRLDYPGFHVSLNASLLARIPAPAYIIHGDAGSYVKHTQDVQESRLLAGVIPLGDWAEESAESWGTLCNQHGEQRYPTETGDYQSFYRNIHAHLSDRGPLLTPAQQAVNALKMIDLVLESHQQQRTLSVRFNEE